MFSSFPATLHNDKMVLMIELSIMTLNVWGIPYISSDRYVRIIAIANFLAEGKFDFISLQEVWSEDDYQLIKEKTKSTFPYTHYFYSGAFGSGLCIFSKYPIVSTFFHPWAVNGYVHRIQHADWFGGKGVGLCRVLVNNTSVNIYLAHLHAEYDTKNDDYKAHRVIQAFDTAQFIETSRNDAVVQILAGDLNISPGDIAYKILNYSSKMIDCCNDESIKTNECKTNSYTKMGSQENGLEGIRIDHILVRPAKNYKVVVQEYGLPLSERVPGQSFSYSDHEAVYAKIQISKKVTNNDCGLNECNVFEKIDQITDNDSRKETINVLQECITICKKSLDNLRSDRNTYLSMALIVTIALIGIMDIVPPYGLQILYLLVKFLLCGIISYFVFMATLWNIMERHGVLSGKLSMEIVLNFIMKYEDTLT